MIRWLAVGATLVSIGVLSLVLRWGTSGRAGTPSFEMAVLVLNAATPLASVLLTWRLWRGRHRGGAMLSASPLVLMVVGTAVALVGTAPPLRVLLWLDLYVLLAFVAVLSRFGREIISPSPLSSADASAPRRRSAA